MMTELYSDKELRKLKFDLRKYSCIFAAVIIAFAAVCLTLCFFVTENNVTALKAVNITVSIVGGCAALYILFNKILPVNSRKAFTKQIISEPRVVVCGTVTGVGKTITVAKRISAIEIILNAAQGTTLSVLLDCTKDVPEFVGKEVEFITARDKIVAYMVKE
ncbi:MAG: hypothetical protein K2L72_00570 [Clostridia bacterium]|nr:hypothetical protein [Clostridia bacterium]